MKRKNISAFFVVVLFSAIPSALSYLANSSLIFEWLKKYEIIGQGVNIAAIQDRCLWLGIILSAVFLSANLFWKTVQRNQAIEERNSLIKMNKSILATALGETFHCNQLSFSVRIFIPKHQIFYAFADWIKLKNFKKSFIIKNIDLISDEGRTKDLQFEVSPKQEGLVGACYAGRMMVYDDDLENTNSKDYNLGEHQISRTSNLKWSVCCPIHDESNAVVAIIALDGTSKITIDKSNENALREHLVAFSRMLYDFVPQLFKR